MFGGVCGGSGVGRESLADAWSERGGSREPSDRERRVFFCGFFFFIFRGPGMMALGVES